MSTPSSLLPLEHLHPALWRAHQLGRGREAVQASGYAQLDAELPGGGWPQRAITELLLAGSGWGEIRLLAPALARVGAAGRGVLLLGPPAEPCAEALAQLGLDLSRCVVIRGDDLLWPLEQALRSGQVGAVVAWVPASLKGEGLRRLQLAAQSHEGPAFVVRPPAAAQQPSPAPLRLALAVAGPDALAVRLVKRRGPALAQALVLALPPVLSRTARARALTPRGARAAALQALARANADA
jgi:protein ImuA